MQAVVENHSPLIKFDEKAETPSNITVPLLAGMSECVVKPGSPCESCIFLLVTVFGHHQVVSS